MQQAVEHKILSRIYGTGRGWIFSPAHFAGLGCSFDHRFHALSPRARRRHLKGQSRHFRLCSSCHAGTRPSPNIDQTADALARKFRLAHPAQPEPQLRIYSVCPHRFPRAPSLSPTGRTVRTPWAAPSLTSMGETGTMRPPFLGRHLPRFDQTSAPVHAAVLTTGRKCVALGSLLSARRRSGRITN